MRISYDAEVDALYLTLVEGEHECRTVRLSEDVALDFGSDETLVGIEVLDAKRLLGEGKLPQLAVDNLALRPASKSRTAHRIHPGKLTAKTGKRLRKAG